jgi:hypothetical protein
MRFLILVLICFCCIPGCQNEIPNCERNSTLLADSTITDAGFHDLLPLKVGNYWYYSGSYGSTAMGYTTLSFSWEVISARYINAQEQEFTIRVVDSPLSWTTKICRIKDKYVLIKDTNAKFNQFAILRIPEQRNSTKDTIIYNGGSGVETGFIRSVGMFRYDWRFSGGRGSSGSGSIQLQKYSIRQ